MAYGVGTPANDWVRATYGSPNVPVDSKITHASLGTNILANHGTNLRRWVKHASGATGNAVYYRYANAAYNSAKPHSIRSLLRWTSIDGNIYPQIICNSDVAIAEGGSLLAVNNYRFYCLSSDCVSIWIGDSKGSATWHGCLKVVSHTPAIPAMAVNDWYFVRMDTMRQGNDMRIQVYLVKGATACDTLDGNGEPAWGSAVIDCYHKLGFVAPTVITGTDGPADFGTATPHYGDGGDYNGSNGIVIGQFVGGGGQTVHFDSIRIKQMP